LSSSAIQLLEMGKTKVSKNKKRNWRKHVDIKEIEDHLEDERLQERTGGLVAEKSNDELFFLDKATDIVSSSNKTESENARKNKQLRCEANLLPDPSIKPARIKHNVKSSQTKRLCAAKRLLHENGILTATEKKAIDQRNEARKESLSRRRAKNHVNRATYDLWGETAESEGLESDEHYMKVTRKRLVNAPKHLRMKPSSLAAVEIPHKGASYNPALDDYQELITKASSVEVVKAKKEMKIVRATDEMFPDKNEAPTETDYLNEMSSGLFEGHDGADSDDEDQPLSVNPPVRREDKKTITQRNKEKRQRLQVEKAQKEKDLRIKKHQMLQIKSNKKRVAEVESQRKEKAVKKAALKERFKDKPKKLGRLQYEHTDIEVKLQDELQGSLRLLKPEGHLMEDRFKSLQRRNIIEPRKRAKRLRKYQLKEFEKKSHRNVPE